MTTKKRREVCVHELRKMTARGLHKMLNFMACGKNYKIQSAYTLLSDLKRTSLNCKKSGPTLPGLTLFAIFKNS